VIDNNTVFIEFCHSYPDVITDKSITIWECNVFNSDYKYIVVLSSIGFEASRVDIAGAITSYSSIYSL
jgi:hypothetical protein